jgi:uncharacterized protein YkwD
MAWQPFSCPHCSKPFRVEAGPQPQRVACPGCRQSVTVPAATPGRWYYARAREKVGPLGEEQLRALAASGQLAPADMVWEEGSPRWLQAGTVPGLFPPPRPPAIPPRPGGRWWPVAVAALVLTAVTALTAWLSWRERAPAAGPEPRRERTAQFTKSPEPTPPAVPRAKAPDTKPPEKAPPEEAPPDKSPEELPRDLSPPSPPVGLDTAGAVLCPSPGQEEVPLHFTGWQEVPGAAPGKVVWAGYPVTVTFPFGRQVRNVQATLEDADGDEVSVWLSTPESPAVPGGQRNSVCLIARAPLAPNTSYRVRVAAEVSGKPWARDWTFTTGTDGPPAAVMAADALARINTYRKQAGLSAVALDPELNKGCQAHCDYLARNAGHPSTEGLGAHDEDPALPGYTPEGQRAGKASVLAWGDTEPLEAIDLWVATLYHRVPLLDPQLERIGFARARRGRGWVTALDSSQGKGTRPAPLVVLYPAPGQKDVPVAFPPGEEPNPIPEDRDGRAGYPITATFARGLNLRGLTFTLADAEGAEVPVWFSSPEKPANPAHARYQGTTACLIAKDPLRPGTTYTVTGAGEVDGKPWSQTWTFTTAEAPDPAAHAAEVLAQVNAQRRAAGLPPVTLDPALSKGCAAHAAYLVRNADHPSVKGNGVLREDPNLPGYTPEGAAAARSSDIHPRAPSPRVHVEGMMGTLRRRVSLLDPALRRVGYAYVEDVGRGWVCVLDVIRGRELGTAQLRPAAGDKGAAAGS